MSHRSEDPQRSIVEAQSRPDAPRAVESLSRRSVLLKGLSKGGGVAVAFVPIRTLAQSTTILVTADNTLCTQSGQMSNVMSRAANKVTCTGYRPGYYALSTTAWPVSGYTTGTRNSLRFSDLFTTSTDTRKVQDILTGAPSTDAAYWIAANFNARQAGALNFPYQVTDVVAQFNQYAGGSFTLIDLYKKYLSSRG